MTSETSQTPVTSIKTQLLAQKQMLYRLSITYLISLGFVHNILHYIHSGKKKVERIRRIPSHGVAALLAFGFDQANPFRDCIDSLLIDLQG